MSKSSFSSENKNKIIDNTENLTNKYIFIKVNITINLDLDRVSGGLIQENETTWKKYKSLNSKFFSNYFCAKPVVNWFMSAYSE